MPTRARSFGRLVFGSPTEMPSTMISPFWNGSSALTHLISVDLPDPDGPQTTTTSPFSTLVVQSVSTWKLAVPLGDVVDVDHGMASPVADRRQRMMAIFFCSRLHEHDSVKQRTK